MSKDVRQIPVPTNANRFLTISNLLSIFRAFLVIPFVILMLSELPSKRIYGIIILAIAALTDKLDGVFARKFNEITEWGKILDPLADKIGVAAAAVTLTYLGSIPVWFLLVVLARDVFIFLGGVYLKSAKGIVLQSNEIGKWAVGVMTFVLFLALLDVRSLLFDMSIWASVGLLAISSWMYVGRFVRTLRNAN